MVAILLAQHSATYMYMYSIDHMLQLSWLVIRVQGVIDSCIVEVSME